MSEAQIKSIIYLLFDIVMNRNKICKNMVTFLEKNINCENVMRLTNNFMIKSEDFDPNSINRLLINSIPTSFEIINYNDSDEISKKYDRKDIENMFNIFDFITEANYTGFEIFPYLYGVLDCRNGKDSEIYLYYEEFDDILPELINQITQPKDWYDLIFQLIMINNYITVIKNYTYDGILEKHFFKRIPKPYHKTYYIGNNNYNITHNFIIVYWDKCDITQKSKISKKTNIVFLTEYINTHKKKLNISSERIIELLNNLSKNVDINDIMEKYYNKFKHPDNKLLE